MEEFIYRKRVIDGLIDQYMSFAGAIYLRGPKLAGKTTTAKRHAQTIFELSSSKKKAAFSQRYEFDYEGIFSSPKPILFDEWQECPALWDDIRSEVDEHHSSPGQFLLTGSRELKEEESKLVSHSGTGRIYDLVMLPMSLYESGESGGEISLISLFSPDTRLSGISSSLSIEDLIYASCRGGWPSALGIKDRSLALRVPRAILNNCINGRDYPNDDDDGERLDPELMRRFLKAYARVDSSYADDKKIMGDIASASFPVSDYQYQKCKSRLRKLYLIDELESWSPAFRSRTNLLVSPKREFVDPSLAIASLSLTPEELRLRPIDYGFFFENLCIRDLKIYASPYFGRVEHFRDRYGNEADAVLILEDGRYALVEIKLGFGSAIKGAESLLKLKADIEKHNEETIDDTHKMRMPSALIVLHAGKEAVTYKDQVHIVPIGCLKD